MSMHRRLSIVLDWPAQGYEADLLNNFLAHAGISPSQCQVTTLLPTVPRDPTKLKWESGEVQGALANLATTLTAQQPNLCLLLGSLSLRALAGEKRSIKDFKGYVWRAAAIREGVKCIGAWHPATVLKDMGLSGEQKFYLARAKAELATDDLVVPVRHIEWDLTRDDFIDRFRAWRKAGTPLAADIEGGCHSGPACHGFADSANHAVVLPIYGVDGVSRWSEQDETLLTEEVAALWEDEGVPKIIQNAPYEFFVLAWALGICVRGLKDDTMLKHAELYAELDKALEFQACIYTRQPYWKLNHRFSKAEGRHVPYHGSDPKARRATSAEWFIYNGTDCCVTYECNEAMDRQLREGQRRHYEWNMRHLVRTTYSSLRGWNYNTTLAKERLEECMQKLYELQDQINQEAAKAESRAELREFYRALGVAVDGDAGDGCVAQACVAQASQGVEGDERGQQWQGIHRLIPLLTTAFCCAESGRKETREVEEVSWQPMRWSVKSKKWIKGGKRLQVIPASKPESNFYIQAEEPEGTAASMWLKPHRKLTTKRLPVAVETLEDVRRFALASKDAECKRACRLASEADKGAGLSPAQRGELATLLGIHVKLNATGRAWDGFDEEGNHRRGDERDANWFVYEHCGSPKHYTKERGQSTTNLTSNDSALISIWLATKDPRIKAFMDWRSLDTEREALEVTTDPDGRIRCGYVLPGTETMRLACKKSPTGSGYNLQTVTEELRDLFPADSPDHLISNADLRGADGYSIACECLRMGDDTMLRDLEAGLKPVNLIVLLYTVGPHVNKLSRAELKTLQNTVDKNSWEYVATKPIFYGSCFTAGHELLTPDGWKPIEQLGCGEQIATYDLYSREVCFEHPFHMHRLSYTGNLYTFKGHSIDITVTADHRMPYTTNGNPKCLTAAELYHRKSGQLPTAGQFFTCSGVHSESFGRLIAAIHSDGCYPKRSKDMLTFCFRKPRKVKRIKELLAAAGSRFRVRKDAKRGNTYIYVKGIQAYKVWGKEATAKMLSWSHEAMQGYLDEYAYWDGHNDGITQVLFSTKLQHLEWIDTFAHLSLKNACAQPPVISGFGSTVHKIRLNNRTFADMTSLEEKSVREVVQEPVYCPTVSTGYVMVRRNGKVYVSGNCYLMGAKRMSESIKEDSYAVSGTAVFVSPKQCEGIMQMIDVRYWGIKRWQKDEGERMMSEGKIITSLGWQKLFFGRKADKVKVDGRWISRPNRQTHGEWLGTKPQFYTTAATKLALERVWDDPTNRRSDGSFRVEPLHTVHDSLNTQWHKEDTAYAVERLPEWFNNKLLIAGHEIVIPATATYGPSWGQQGVKWKELGGGSII